MSRFGVLLAELHFLRPGWLWGLSLVLMAALFWVYRKRQAEVWKKTVDAHLLPSLLLAGGRHSWLGFLPVALAVMLAVIALAGPSWRQEVQPLFRAEAPLVIALDLSTSIQASDLPPTRLLQARAKLATLLRERIGGDVGLIAYAGESFIVAPLTADKANVALFLDALAPSVMPVDGKRADTAIATAVQLLQQSGHKFGEILLLTDAVDAPARSAAITAASQGYKVSVLGLGTVHGAAYRDADGAIRHARLDEGSLRSLVISGGGRYARLSVDDADLRDLGVLEPGQEADSGSEQRSSSMRLDQGYWLLPPLMLLVLLAFRRRGVAMVLLVACTLPLAQPVRAAAGGGWWLRDDQLQQQRLNAGVQAYRSGDFAAAQRYFESVDSDQGNYNLGNALARQGSYDEAIAAYDRALKQQPDMADALANRETVMAARERQEQLNKSEQRQQEDGGQQGQQKSSDSQTEQNQKAAQDQRDSDTPAPSSGHSERSADKQSASNRPETSASKNSGNTQHENVPRHESTMSQQQADQLQQQRMQQALERNKQDSLHQGIATDSQTLQQREQRQAIEAWLRRVPDDPGGLLRSKFRLEYDRRRQEGK